MYGFIFVIMTTRRNELTLFVCGGKYIASLIFIVEGDGQKFFRDKNFPMYSTVVSEGGSVHPYLCVFGQASCRPDRNS